MASDVVGRGEQLVRTEFRGTVKVDRRRRLVGRERDDPLDAGIKGRLDHILGAHDIRFDALERVVFRGGNLFQRRGMDYELDAFHGAPEPIDVAHIPDEIPQRRMLRDRKPLLHLELFELVPRVNDDALECMLFEKGPDKLLSE